MPLAVEPWSRSRRATVDLAPVRPRLRLPGSAPAASGPTPDRSLATLARPRAVGARGGKQGVHRSRRRPVALAYALVADARGLRRRDEPPSVRAIRRRGDPERGRGRRPAPPSSSAMSKMRSGPKPRGFDTIRIVAIWAPGSAPCPRRRSQALRDRCARADVPGHPRSSRRLAAGSRDDAADAEARAQFAALRGDIVREVPPIRDVIVGNEPNLNRYWLPQFDAGRRGRRRARVRRAARARLRRDQGGRPGRLDQRRRGRPARRSTGPAPAATRIRRRRSSRHGRPPTARAAARQPIMDGFAFHPYGESSSTPRTVDRTRVDVDRPRRLRPKLVALLGEAFDGTAQRARSCRSSTTSTASSRRSRPAKRALYDGRGAGDDAAGRRGDSGRLLRAGARSCACQPTVARALLIFHVTDETDYDRWQSGALLRGRDAEGEPARPMPCRASAPRVGC